MLCEQMSTPAVGKHRAMPGHNSAPGRFTSFPPRRVRYSGGGDVSVSLPPVSYSLITTHAVPPR